MGNKKQTNFGMVKEGLTLLKKESRPHNSTYPKVAVQWLNQALCFYQSLCLVDSEVLQIATFE